MFPTPGLGGVVSSACCDCRETRGRNFGVLLLNPLVFVGRLNSLSSITGMSAGGSGYWSYWTSNLLDRSSSVFFARTLDRIRLERIRWRLFGSGAEESVPRSRDVGAVRFVLVRHVIYMVPSYFAAWLGSLTDNAQVVPLYWYSSSNDAVAFKLRHAHDGGIRQITPSVLETTDEAVKPSLTSRTNIQADNSRERCKREVGDIQGFGEAFSRNVEELTSLAALTEGEKRRRGMLGGQERRHGQAKE